MTFLTNGMEGVVPLDYDRVVSGCGATIGAAAVDQGSEQNQTDNTSKHQTSDDQRIKIGAHSEDSLGDSR